MCVKCKTFVNKPGNLMSEQMDDKSNYEIKQNLSLL